MLAKMWNSMNFHTLLVRMQNDTATFQDRLALPCITKLICHMMRLSCILTWPKGAGLYPEELKTSVPSETCTWMFMAASFIVAQRRKQAFGSGMGKQTMVCADSGILFTTDKAWAVKPGKDMEDPLVHITSERSPSEKATCYVTPAMWHSRKGATREMEEEQ